MKGIRNIYNVIFFIPTVRSSFSYSDLESVALSGVENYFYNTNLNNSKARQKEIYFSLLVESPGLFSSSSPELHESNNGCL